MDRDQCYVWLSPCHLPKTYVLLRVSCASAIATGASRVTDARKSGHCCDSESQSTTDAACLLPIPSRVFAPSWSIFPDSVSTRAPLVRINPNGRCSAFVSSHPRPYVFLLKRSHATMSPHHLPPFSFPAFPINPLASLTRNVTRAGQHPKLFHSLEQLHSSVLSLAADDANIYTGTQDGRICVGIRLSPQHCTTL